MKPKRRWTEADTKTLTEQYLEFRGRGQLAALATALGRTRQDICRKAREFGLTNPGHAKPWMRTPAEEMVRFATIHDSMSDSALAKEFGLTVSGVEKRRESLGLTKNPKLKWARTPHPRGATGMRHTEVVRAFLSIRSTARWEDPDSYQNSTEYRQILSDRTARMQAAGLMRNGYSRGRMGRRPDLDNQHYRSAWEANYARYLNFLKARGEITAWQYEPDTFWFHEIKRGVRSYLPDFKIFEGDRHHYVEVKGWMDQKSKTKLARMAKYYPEVDLRLVGAKEYRQLQKCIGSLIPGWERERP